jgi:hypothetical protein
VPFKFSLGNSDQTIDSWGLDGWVGELAFYPGVLSGPDRDTISDYLAGKWS